MKQSQIILIIVANLFLLFTSCEQDSILDKAPQDKYNSATIWSDIKLADAYLLYCYNNMGSGMKMMYLAGVSDESHFLFDKGTKVYLQGNCTPDNLGCWANTGLTSYDHLTWYQFKTVQMLNVFLDNIDKVADSYEEPKKTDVLKQIDVKKGEAKFIRAYVYAQMCRAYGGLPIFEKPHELTDDFTTVTRASFEETVNFITKECDESAALLKLKSETEMGRATKETAMSLKSRILLFAASDLTADGTAPSELVGYTSPNRTTLWNAAKNAAKAVMDLGIYQLEDFGAPNKEDVIKNYYDFFRRYDLSSNEVIWGRMFSKDKGTGAYSQANLRSGINGYNTWGGQGGTQNFVDDYEMEDGSKFFDHFEIDNGYYKNKSSKFGHESPYYDREARFYASIYYDSCDVAFPRPASLQARDPLSIYERRTHRYVADDGKVTNVVGLDTRQGPIQSWNSTYTGYVWKKLTDDTFSGEGGVYNENAWVEFRYAEILLNYAEACMELGDNTEAVKYINMIRNRVALPDFTGNIEQALRHERQIELSVEDKRWYDIRRWKILEEKMTDCMGIDILEVHQGGAITTTWKQILAQDRKFVQSMYWLPIATDELKRAPGLLQNPNY